MKASVKFMIFFAAVFALMIIVELFRPQPLDWRQTYSKEDKIPYGNFALFSLLPSIFQHSETRVSDKPVFNYLKGEKLNNASYLIVAERFMPDSLDCAALLRFVGEGNTAFIAAEEFGRYFRDTLRFNDRYYIGSFNGDIQLFLLDSTISAPSNRYVYKANAMNAYFDASDVKNSIVLGENSVGNPTFMRISFGKGKFYLCSTPTAFTNYYLLNRTTSQYIAAVFSYIPNGIIIWDEYYNGGGKKAQSSLRFILAHEPLRYAWYILLGGTALFVLFRAKRRQRAIPIIEPPKNASLEFIETVGRLYFERKNNKNIIEKRIAYLMEYIRSQLNSPIIELNDEAAINIAAEKLAVDRNEMKELLAAINRTRNSEQISDELLRDVNRKIELFYKFVRHRETSVFRNTA